jgi:hypothetical protein
MGKIESRTDLKKGDVEKLAILFVLRFLENRGIKVTKATGTGADLMTSDGYLIEVKGTSSKQPSTVQVYESIDEHMERNSVPKDRYSIFIVYDIGGEPKLKIIEASEQKWAKKKIKVLERASIKEADSFSLNEFQKDVYSDYEQGVTPSQQQRNKAVSGSKAVSVPRPGSIRAAMWAYLKVHKDPIYREMEKMALSIKPDSQFDSTHYAWYLNDYNKAVNQHIEISSPLDQSSAKRQAPSVSRSRYPRPRAGSIKAAMLEYLESTESPQYSIMEKIAQRIKPDTAFDLTHYNWYLNWFKKLTQK